MRQEAVGNSVESYEKKLVGRVDQVLPDFLTHGNIKVVDAEWAQLNYFVMNLVFTGLDSELHLHGQVLNLNCLNTAWDQP